MSKRRSASAKRRRGSATLWARQQGSLAALLSFFRRRRQVQQKDLADKISIPASYLAMLESGSRATAPRELIDTIASALELSDFETNGLLRSAGHLPSTDPLLDSYRQQDVITGTPVFLRPLEREAQFQRSIGAREIWVVAAEPFELNAQRPFFYQTVSDKIDDGGGTRYVYFQGDALGFKWLRSKLTRDLHHKHRLESHLQCILAPATFLFFSFAIYNPGQSGSIGRLTVFDDQGVPVGLLPMDPIHINRIYTVLKGIYAVLQESREVDTPYGRFERIHP